MNISMARRIAKKSTHKLFSHVAIITSGKRVLSVGYNRGEVHAEEVAIKRLLHKHRNNKNDPRALTLTSLMFKKRNGHIGTNSFPCEACLIKIAKTKIRWITFINKGIITTIC